MKHEELRRKADAAGNSFREAKEFYAAASPTRVLALLDQVRELREALKAVESDGYMMALTRATKERLRTALERTKDLP